MHNVPQKTCIHCGQTKSLTEFSKDRSRKDGYRETCRVCRSTHRNASRNDHDRAHRRHYDRNRYISDEVYRLKEQERCREKQKRFYREKPAFRQRQLEHSKKNVRRLMQDPVRYRRHLDHNQARVRIWLETKPEWAETYRLKGRLNRQRYRARLSAAHGSFSQDEWQQLCEQYEYRCACCGEKKPLTVDHVIPLSRGGSNAIENIQPLCRTCNSSKKDKHIDYRK